MKKNALQEEKAWIAILCLTRAGHFSGVRRAVQGSTWWKGHAGFPPDPDAAVGKSDEIHFLTI